LSVSRAELARRFLERALEDIKASEVLFNDGLKFSTLQHLEQASEKILKAYFIGFLINSLEFVYQIAERAGASKVYRSIHQLIARAVHHYSVPKHFGHELTGFLNDLLPKLYEGYCGGEFAKYVDYSIKRILIPFISERKQSFIEKLVNAGLTRDRAEKVLEIIVDLLTQIPGVIRDSELQKDLCSKRVEDVIGFIDALEKIKESEKSCLHATVMLFRLINEHLAKYINEKIRDPETLSAIEYAKKLLSEMSEVANLLGIKLPFKEVKLDELLNYIRGNMVILMALPLHSCLVKYYEPSRFPEKDIPEEEFKAIPDALSTIKEIYNIVKYVIDVTA